MTENRNFDAKLKLAISPEALEEAKKPAKPVDTSIQEQIAAANAAKALADAQTALFNSLKAKADAAVAAFKAQIGEVPDSGITGKVELGSKAGVTEAKLLAAKAVAEASEKITKVISPEIQGKTVLLYPGDEIPTFHSLLNYQGQLAMVANVFAQAQKISEVAEEEAQIPEDSGKERRPAFAALSVSPAAAVGVSLEALSKILGFFRTDYTFDGVDVTEDNDLLVHSLAGALVVQESKPKEVKVPSVYNAQAALFSSTEGIVKDISDKAIEQIEFQGLVHRHEKISGILEKLASDETDPHKKADLLEKAIVRSQAAEVLKGAIKDFDDFISRLGKVDDKGVTPLSKVIHEEVIADALKNNHRLLLVQVKEAGGAYYTKKNLWTFLGTIPFFHMGGIVASYLLLEGDKGQVLASGVVPVHGGWVRADELQEWVNPKNKVNRVT